MRIAVAADHAGYRLKTVIGESLAGAGHEVADMGTDSEASVDYPGFCAAAAREVVAGRADVAIVMGGSGQGEAIAANKVNGARAALCLDEYTARLARQHNDANVLSLGARILADAFALIIVDIFLTTPFEGGRHQARLDQLRVIEREECADRFAEEPPVT
ncbi:MAG: ribose 5-phosphate isomerase B [Acidimicrobiales bacterium]